MSKQVRWQVPFVSRLGTAYRVDIYDEGYTGTPVQLLGGTSPFTTDEDSSDDYFAPIRVQTGTLTVCPHDEDGNVLITLDDILPANNISRPVRLVNVGTGAIEWQGFLSCEAYDQDYTDIPQHLQLPVISVLEAMASVQLNPSRSNGLTTVKSAIKTALSEMMTQSGMDFYTHVNYSGTSYQIFNKYIDQSVFFDSKEYNNENSTTYIVSGLSVKNVLERLAQYMGWVVREQGTKIYFERMGEDIYTWEDTYAQFGEVNPGVQMISFVTKTLATDVNWMGVDHKRTVQQGAKSVEVVAKLEKYGLNISLPDSPLSPSQNYTEPFYTLPESGDWTQKSSVSVSSICCTDLDISTLCSFNLFTTGIRGGITGTATIDKVLEAACINPAQDPNNTYCSAIGAFMASIKVDKEGETDEKYVQGLYTVGLGWNHASVTPNNTNHLFDLHSVLGYRLPKGKLVLSCKGVGIYRGWVKVWGDVDGDTTNIEQIVCLRFGDKYWDGQSWVDTFTTTKITFTDGKYEVDIPNTMTGDLSIRLYASNEKSKYISLYLEYVYDYFITELSIEYDQYNDGSLSDRSENHYFRLLGTNFRDEISIGTELASTLNNQPSPSLIMDNSTTPMKTLDYLVSGGTESRRPEVDLLNRLATYYGAARQRLDLIVEHPTVAPLPLLRLNGISPDNRKYLPLAESRDWREEICTIKCFEMP